MPSKPPGTNRPIPLLDRAVLGVTSAVAARMVVEDILSATIASETTRLTTVEAVRRAMQRGIPVLLTAWLPNEADAFGRFSGRKYLQTMVVVSWHPTRRAFRLMNTRGVGWGQMGRVWLPSADLKTLLAHPDTRAELPRIEP